MKADPDRDEIAIDGKTVSAAPERVYLMLNKPRGYVTTLADEKGRKDISLLVADCAVRVWPVGRLDMYSEGLLLCTNDGDLTYRMEHPSEEIEKEYLVRVNGWHESALQILTGSISLDGYQLSPAQVKKLKGDGQTALLSIVIHEGRNRQIRRMCELAGLRVLRLKRIREGTLSLGDLQSGSWRYLTQEELQMLCNPAIMQD